MSENKEIVKKYLDGFRETNHEKILSCLTDDIDWDMPGFFHLSGKQAFDNEIENDVFEGKPEITVVRMIEENDIVIVEGAVKAKVKNSGILEALFCDVFQMSNNKIKKLTTYQVNLNDPFNKK